MKSQIKPLFVNGMLIPLFLTAAVLHAQSGDSRLSSDDLLRQAQQEMQRQHYSQATDYCNAALKLAPGDDDIHILLGRLYFIAQQFSAARQEWRHTLYKQPKNRDVLQYLINLEANCGNYAAALTYADKALGYYINDRDLLLKKYDLLWMNNADTALLNEVLFALQKRYGYDEKVKALLNGHYQEQAEDKRKEGKWADALLYYDSLLAISPGNTAYILKRSEAALAAGRYSEAITGAEQLCRLQPEGNRACGRLEEVCMTAARNAVGRQRIAYARRLLKWQPGNRQVLDFLLNNCYEQKDYENALLYANLALEHYKEDTVFMLKKLGLLQEQQYYGGAAALADRLLLLKRDRGFEENYTATYVAASNVYMQNGNLAAGAEILGKGLKQLPQNRTLLLAMSAAKYRQGDTATALQVLNVLPGVQQDEQYRQLLADMNLQAARTAMRKAAYNEADGYIKKVLQVNAGERDALWYAIQLACLRAAYAEAIMGCETFLRYFPSDSLVMAKQAGLYMQQQQFTSAIAVAASLQRRYTSDKSVTDLCADAWWQQGKVFNEKGMTDSAMACFKQVLQYRAADTLALIKLVGGFVAKKQYDSILLYTQQGLQQWPEQIALLREKAVALEMMGRYQEAVKAVMAWKQYDPGNKRLDDYLLQIKGRLYKNQLGILHLQSFYDNGTRTALISSIQYMHRFQRGVLLGRVNYGDRQSGNGVQLEAEGYLNHGKQNYSWLWLGWSNSLVFPKYRASYSWFHSFGKGWEGELGFRYLKADTIHTYTPVLSVAKSAGSYWGSLRGFFTRDAGKWYESAVFTNRFYRGETKDFLAVILGIGVSPDDRSRNFQFGRLLGMTTTSATVGYQKYLGIRNIIAAYAAWNHLQLSGVPDINQYDVYISWYRNF